MRRSVFALSLILALVVGGAQAGTAADYDAPTVRQAMGRCLVLLGAGQKALDARDWKALGSAFREFAEIGTTLTEMLPSQDAEEVWKSIWKDFTAAALAGQEEADKQGLALAQGALDKLYLLMQQGHREFR